MADRPIIFSGPMVQALLAGRKSQTRRVLKPQPTGPVVYHQTLTSGMCVGLEREPPYAPGDRLYVREAHSLWADAESAQAAQLIEGTNDPCIYRADYKPETDSEAMGGSGWRPSIHMPRWASRLTLTVTEARVQRLQEISEADAVAEGVTPYVSTCADDNAPATDAFMDLWNSLHGPDAWDANPWVVAVTFSTERRNIDAI